MRVNSQIYTTKMRLQKEIFDPIYSLGAQETDQGSVFDPIYSLGAQETDQGSVFDPIYSLGAQETDQGSVFDPIYSLGAQEADQGAVHHRSRIRRGQQLLREKPRLYAQDAEGVGGLL